MIATLFLVTRLSVGVTVRYPEFRRRDVRSELAAGELLNEVGDGAEASAEGGADEDLAGAGTIRFGIVEVGDSRRGDASSDGRDIGLPVVIVAFADDGIRNGVGGAGWETAPAFDEVAWILMEKRWKNGTADESAVHEVAVVGGVTLGEGGAVLSPGVDICSVLSSCGDSH